ncbi:MAG: hypothetical protein ACRDFS_06280, partial [Chloroflexota bacterium]
MVTEGETAHEIATEDPLALTTRPQTIGAIAAAPALSAGGGAYASGNFPISAAQSTAATTRTADSYG